MSFLLLRNCALEHLAGFVIDEGEAEVGGALTQAATDARAVLGVAGGGPRILVHQTILECAEDETAFLLDDVATADRVLTF